MIDGFKFARGLSIAALSLCTLVSGCTSIGPMGKPKLEFTSADTAREFSESFPEAYATQSEDGVYDVVLRNTTLHSKELPLHPGHQIDLLRQLFPGQQITETKLMPVKGMPISQVMHLRVFWRPPRGAKANSPAATNSTIHWYILADPTQPHPNFIQYDGAGFIRVTRDDEFFLVEILNADLKSTATRGPMRDPIGPGTLNGYFRARIDPQRVQSLLAELPNRTASARLPQ
jgi:hypothetical protein